MAGRCWTKAEDAILRAEYAKNPSWLISQYLDRTVWAIKHRVRTLGLRTNRRGRPPLVAGGLILCAGCGEEKKYHADGLCKRCYGRMNMARWRERNPEKARVAGRRFRERHLEERRARCREYNRRHRKRLSADRKEWGRQNREKVNANASKRRARKRVLPATLTGDEVQEIISYGHCFYCNKRFEPRELVLDHFVPVTKGGGTTRANMVAACQECNNKKYSKMPEEILEQLCLVS